jgi:hypothetical protein
MACSHRPNTKTHEEILATIKTDIMVVENHRNGLLPSSELKQIESLTDIIETRFRDFCHILPRPYPCRALIGIGGSVLKTSFGIAKESDIYSLCKTLDDLHSSTSDLAHSVSSQVTYIRKHDSLVDINSAAIRNLSGIVNDVLVQSHSHLQQVSKDVLLLNTTLRNYNELFTAVRQLEFLLLQTVRQVDNSTPCSVCYMESCP